MALRPQIVDVAMDILASCGATRPTLTATAHATLGIEDPRLVIVDEFGDVED